MAVARSFFDSSVNTLCTSGFVDDVVYYIVERKSQKRRRRVCFVQFAWWQHQSDFRKRCLIQFVMRYLAAPLAKSAVSKRILCLKIISVISRKILNIYCIKRCDLQGGKMPDAFTGSVLIKRILTFGEMRAPTDVAKLGAQV